VLVAAAAGQIQQVAQVVVEAADQVQIRDLVPIETVAPAILHPHPQAKVVMEVLAQRHTVLSLVIRLEAAVELVR